MDTDNEKQKFDLEERTFNYSRLVRSLIRKIPKDITGIEDCKQLIRSSGSVGANYIEVNEALSKKDFIHRLKIVRKEAKESRYWLKLLKITNKDENEIKDKLIQESTQIIKIISSILNKVV